MKEWINLINGFRRISKELIEQCKILDKVKESVGLLAEILRLGTQPNFYCNSKMFPSPRGFHYQNQQAQNNNTNNGMVPKNDSNTFNFLL